MAYADNQRRLNLKPVAGVAIVHLAIGYAFISGLASDVMRQVPTVFRLIDIPAIAPPPPDVPQPPVARPASPATPTVARQEVALPPRPAVDPVLVSEIQPLPVPGVETVRVAPPAPPATTSRASGARARGDRAGWITTDDYPARALRNGEEGSVGISLRIGADGRVSDCAVTASSGSPQLDEATCRLYQRRARFTPAQDEEGRVIATTYLDRIRWTIPH
ncbi:energy transducer TonB [Sphingomonas solaris]|uniref:energy transducer TonB n=1 Tax=Alterirhizorhabdus solaris TaxID=2529389 RepID=UPI0013969341|nr:energy transducer TonB [Sphingomonas solaris]